MSYCWRVMGACLGLQWPENEGYCIQADLKQERSKKYLSIHRGKEWTNIPNAIESVFTRCKNLILVAYTVHVSLISCLPGP